MTLILRRLPLLVLLLAAISAAVFTLTQFLPGDPAFIAAGGGDATPEMIAHARARLGLDRPRWIQYLLYMRNAVTGDFGRSLAANREIIQDLWYYRPRNAGERISHQFFSGRGRQVFLEELNTLEAQQEMLSSGAIEHLEL